MLRAKRAIEAMLRDGRSYLEVPKVEDIVAFTAELRAAGVDLRRKRPLDVDVKWIRTKTGYTQEQFALRYNLDLATLRNWEQGRNQPDPAARNFLDLIEAHPKEVEAMMWEE